MKHIKKLAALAALFTSLSFSQAQNVLQTPAAQGIVTLSWNYSAAQLTDTLFKIRGSKTNTSDKSTWQVLTNVFEKTNVVVNVTPGEYFFTGTASNLWGETIFFPVVSLPALPRSDVVVTVIKVQ